MAINRIKLNSQSLKKEFAKDYQDFFSRSMIITSAPGTITWAGDYAVMEGGFAILQKIPLRVYIGLELNTNDKTEIGDFKYFSKSKGQFKNCELELPVKNNLVRFVDHYLEDVEKDIHLKINILSEVSPGRGLNLSGALSASLALALELYFKKIKIKEMEKWKQTDLTTLTRKIDLKFDQVFRLSWKMNAIFHGNVSSGGSSFAPFIYTPFPVVYFSEKRAEINDKENFSNIRFPKYLDGDWRGYEQIFYGAIKFEELFNYKSLPNWPIDFGAIYSGDERMTATTHGTIGEIRDILKTTTDLVKEDFAPYMANLPVTPYFYKLATKHGWRGLWNIYVDPTIVSSMEVLNAFRDLFEKGLADKSIKNLFAALNRMSAIYQVLELSSPLFQYIQKYLNDDMIRLGDPHGAATKPLGCGKKGDLLFVLPYHGLRDQIDRVINEMIEETKEHMYLDYASWYDGIEEEGAKLEQFLEGKIYSEFISRGAVLIKHLNYKGFIHKDLYTQEEFHKMIPDADLLMDEIDGKIYIKGTQLTSKELHSATATISILKELINKPGEAVANATLPISSYTQDRNELQSKIITPLCKIIQKNTGRKLSFKINGGITNFTVKLGSTGVDILLVKRIF